MSKNPVITALPPSSKNEFVIVECALYGVGVSLLLFSRYFLTDAKPTLPKEVSFKSLTELTEKETHENLAKNTNGLTTTIVALAFTVVAFIVQIFEMFTYFVRPEIEISKLNLFLMNLGPSMFLISLIICLNLLQENDVFKRIINNQVGVQYYTLMHFVVGAITCNFLVLVFHYFFELSIAVRSGMQFLLGVVFLIADYFLYETLVLQATGG